MNQNDQKEAIKELQGYLQILYKDGYDLPFVAIDGIYSDVTEQAVKDFQLAVGLAPSGETDFDTWTALVAASRQAMIRLEPSKAITPFERPLSDNEVRSGEISDLVTIIQLMLKTLTQYEYSDVIADGYFGDVTENAVIDFQMRNGLPVTGVVDKITWNALATAYNKYVSNDH